MEVLTTLFFLTTLVFTFTHEYAILDKSSLSSLMEKTSARNTVPQISRRVCARHSNNFYEEQNMTLTLKNLVVEGMGSYLSGGQSCDADQKVTRKKRSTTVPSFISTLPNGTTYVGHPCLNKNEIILGTSTEGTTRSYNMCWTCGYDITLPESYLPRHYKAITCNDPSNEAAIDCLMGEGVCVTNTQYFTAIYNANNTNNISEWQEVTIAMPRSCSCQILEGSIFDTFVPK